MALNIVEGVESIWVYHLQEDGQDTTLCGRPMSRMMTTRIPLKTWGVRTHIGERYCKECGGKRGTDVR